MKVLPKILPPPEKRPPNLPHSCRWLGGEGAGSWFTIEKTGTEGVFEVRRFSPTGEIECEGLFSTENPFDIEKAYEISYPSHCAKVTVVQKGKTKTLRPVGFDVLSDLNRENKQK